MAVAHSADIMTLQFGSFPVIGPNQELPGTPGSGGFQPLRALGNWWNSTFDNDPRTNGGFRDEKIVVKQDPAGGNTALVKRVDMTTGAVSWVPATTQDFANQGQPGMTPSTIDRATGQQKLDDQRQDTTEAITDARRRKEDWRNRVFGENRRRTNIDRDLTLNDQGITRENNRLLYQIASGTLDLNTFIGVNNVRRGEREDNRLDSITEQQILNSQFKNAMTVENNVYNRWRDKASLLTQTLPGHARSLGAGIGALMNF